MAAFRQKFSNIKESAVESYQQSQNYPYFAVTFLIGCFFIVMSVFFLPSIVISPYKVANLFNVGSILILSSFAVIYGWFDYCINQFLCGPRGAIAFCYLTMLGVCTYFSIFRRDFLLTIACLVIELVFLVYYVAAYFPGGVDGISFLFKTVWKGISGCFRACFT
jgi:hypothetical protein